MGWERTLGPMGGAGRWDASLGTLPRGPASAASPLPGQPASLDTGSSSRAQGGDAVCLHFSSTSALVDQPGLSACAELDRAVQLLVTQVTLLETFVTGGSEC